MATVATRREKNFSLRQRTKTHYEHKIPLTPTDLLMEGRYTQNPSQQGLGAHRGRVKCWEAIAHQARSF